MNALLIYMFKVAVYLAAFYLVYSLMLSRDTSYVRNRLFILLSLVSALIMPLVVFQNVRPVNIQFFGKFLSDVFITASPDSAPHSNKVLALSDTFHIIRTIYFIGTIIFLVRLFADLLNLLILIGRQRKAGCRIIRYHDFNTAGFSAMGHIFINSRLCHEDETEIIRHEQNHLRQYHFLDIIFIELVKAFQWFNPVVYLFNRSLRAIHEFQADQDCLSSGVPVINYQKLLLSQVFKTKAFNMTSSFSNPSLIKRRMIMMTKKRTSPLANMKLLMVIPVTGLVLLSVSAFRGNTDNSENLFNTGNVNQPSQGETMSGIKPSPPSAVVKNDPVDDPGTAPFVSVEEMPVFPGGDVALLKYIAENTTYPELAKKNNIQGRVIIRFCISSKGNINQVSIIKGVDPELDAEAIRVVKTLPVFEPGKQSGKPVPVWYMVPITFNLK